MDQESKIRELERNIRDIKLKIQELPTSEEIEQKTNLWRIAVVLILISKIILDYWLYKTIY